MEISSQSNDHIKSALCTTKGGALRDQRKYEEALHLGMQAHNFERLHQTKEEIPKNGISIDATASVACVVDEIVRLSEADINANYQRSSPSPALPDTMLSLITRQDS